LALLRGWVPPTAGLGLSRLDGLEAQAVCGHTTPHHTTPSVQPTQEENKPPRRPALGFGKIVNLTTLASDMRLQTNKCARHDIMDTSSIYMGMISFIHRSRRLKINFPDIPLPLLIHIVSLAPRSSTCLFFNTAWHIITGQ